MTFITFLSLLGTAIFFENNTNIVNSAYTPSTDILALMLLF